MRYPGLDYPVADQAPNADYLTDYDQEHLSVYVRLLDADVEGADWMDVARLVLADRPGPRTKTGAWRLRESPRAR